MRHGDQVFRIELQQIAQTDADARHQQRRRDAAHPGMACAVKIKQQEQAHAANRRNRRIGLEQDCGQVGYGHKHALCGRRNHTEQRRDLFNNDDGADGRQHALDHGYRQEQREAPGLEQAEYDLHQAGKTDCHQQQGITRRQVAAAEQQHTGQQGRGESRRRPADGDIGAAQKRENQPGDDGRDDPGDRRCAGSDGNAERQR